MKRRRKKQKSGRSTVRIIDVARRAGVSSATVSRVLSNKPHVRPEMQERVWEAVEELGYRPNRVARSLRVQKSNTIGLIISDIQNPFFTSIVRAVEDTAQKEGFSIFLCNSDENPEKEKMYLNLMHDEHVAGIIVSPTRETEGPYESLLDNGVPIVTLDRRITGAKTDTVLINNVDAASQLVTHLISDGHCRVGAVVGPSDITTGRERLEGYVQALKQHDLEVLPELIIQVLHKEKEGFEATTKLLALPQPPDAIFAGNNLLAVGALKAIRAQGLRIPDDVALASFDEMTWTSLIEPGLTVVRQPTYDLGRTATELLLQRLKEPERTPREVVLKGELVIRGSCGHH